MTFELAAASLFSILVTVRGTVPATALATILVTAGVIAYALYFVAFIRQNMAGDKLRSMEWILLGWTVFPLAAYAFSAVYFWEVPLCVKSTCLPVDDVFFPLSVEYLVLSGVLQAFLWYLRSWERPLLKSAGKALKANSLRATRR